MRPLGALAFYLLFVFVGGALAAPWLHYLAHWLTGHFGSFQDLANQPFSRYMSRCFMVLALLGLLPLVRVFGITGLRDIGLPGPNGELKGWLRGLVVGFLFILLVIAAGLAAGVRTWEINRTATEILRHLGNAVGAALAVGLLEEVLFRGAIYGAFRRAYSPSVGLIVSCGIFALAHFFTRAPWRGEIHWHTGLQILPHMLAGLADPRQLIPGFLNLALTGAVLVRIYERSGTLYACIGLHMGWIFWLKTGAFFTRLEPSALPWIWGGRQLVDGWVGLPLVALLWLATDRLFPSRHPLPAKGSQ